VCSPPSFFRLSWIPCRHLEATGIQSFSKHFQPCNGAWSLPKNNHTFYQRANWNKLWHAIAYWWRTWFQLLCFDLIMLGLVWSRNSNSCTQCH
jgi:hypothetical protein